MSDPTRHARLARRSHTTPTHLHTNDHTSFEPVSSLPEPCVAGAMVAASTIEENTRSPKHAPDASRVALLATLAYMSFTLGTLSIINFAAKRKAAQVPM